MELVSNQQRNRMHPHKFALWVAIASIIMMFAGLTSAYLVKSKQANWEIIEIPTYFVYSTIFILASSLTIQGALRSFKQREMKQYRSLVLATFVLATIFLLLQWLGFQWLWQNGVRFEGAGEGQFFYIIAGLHGLHVIGGIVALIIVLIKTFVGKKKVYNSVGLEVLSTYWHFVDILWVYLFVFFVWLG